MGLLFALLIHIIVLSVILYLVFQYLIPMLPDAVLQRIVTILVVLIAILSFLRYLPAGYLPAW
jgi:hypothetical protein